MAELIGFQAASINKLMFKLSTNYENPVFVLLDRAVENYS